MKKSLRNQRGFSISELLVGMTLFGIVGMSATGFIMDSTRRTSLESRVSVATQEAQSALQLLISELRISSQVSPYLPGTDTNLTLCSSDLSVEDDEIKFVVAHDDANGSNGLQRYLVGYRYDSSTKEIIRGEIQTSEATTCNLPAGDPTDLTNGAVIASRIVRVDQDGNGVNEPVFEKNGDLININFGVRVSVSSSLTSTQILSSEILLRSN